MVVNRMKISAKGRYAIKLMMDLAIYRSGKPISLKDVARRQEISEKFLEQIIAILNRAGFVRSIRGPQGGYMLTMEPKEYTVGMILRLTEGDLGPTTCVGSTAAACEEKDTCVTVRIWQQINDAINNVVDNITLENLVDWQNELAADQYVI